MKHKHYYRVTLFQEFLIDADALEHEDDMFEAAFDEAERLGIREFDYEHTGDMYVPPDAGSAGNAPKHAKALTIKPVGISVEIGGAK